ncbi:MAG: helix-turn-helix transcriptional regulator [Clostridia bacterium]|nr:helix-turn-helix transcriptional regulator [Clostridia bacterium]
MDLKTVSKFIQEQRKAKSLTQVQLAEKLGVSEKTVSKWETGRGFPDTSLIMPLCNELGITANELLCGKLVSSDNEYKEAAEKNLVLLKGQQQRSAKNFLLLEMLLIWLGIVLLLGCCVVASYVEMLDVYRFLIIGFGFLNVAVVCVVGIIIETKVGFYECAHCHYKYVPTYKQVLWAMHMGRTRYMKCPNCHEKSWQKKKVSDN